MGTKVGSVVALLSLACCLTNVAGQNYSASFYEMLGYYGKLVQEKSIDWNTTIHYRNVSLVQQQCYNHSVQIHEDMKAYRSYAITMLDSTGKLNPSGLLEGRWDDFGSFKGCRDRVKDTPDRPEDIEPMYCAVFWGGIPPELSGGARFFLQGLCVPNTCSDYEVNLLADTGLLGIKPMSSWTPTDVFCQREEDYASYSTGAIIAITIIAIILLMLVISTLYEFIITISFSKQKKKSLASSKTGRFFLSFSVYSNTKKVFDTYQPPGQLPALHGMRVISTLWIIYGHTDFFADNTVTTNRKEMNDWFSQWWFFIRGSMDMSVDTFLLLSALLVSYLFLKQLKKNVGTFTWKDLGLHYLHRYWRLTPVYAFLILIYACLMVYMGTGPAWAYPGSLAMFSARPCHTYVWTNLLYINNYFTGGKQCFGWAWYLGVDMQLYIVAPGLLILLYKKPVVGAAFITLLLTGSMAAYGLMFHYLVNIQGLGYLDTVYTNTLPRMGPYMVGLLLGYVLFRNDRKVPSTCCTKVLMLCGWAIAAAVAFVFVVGPEFGESPYAILGVAAWRAFYRTMFSCAVAWVVFACGVGYGGIITEFLSWGGWVPLSRLTYTAYLVHPIIMHVHTMSLKTPLFYSETNWWFYFIAYSFMAFLCGFVASIMVEFPFFGLEKLIFPQRRGRGAGAVKVQTNDTNEGHDNQAIEMGEVDNVREQHADETAEEANGHLAEMETQPMGKAMLAVSMTSDEEQFDHKF